MKASAMAAFCGGSSGTAQLNVEYMSPAQAYPRGTRVEITHENGHKFFAKTEDGREIVLGMNDFEWLPKTPAFTAAEVEREINSMNKFARNGWTYGCAGTGELSPRGKTIQDMLKMLKGMLDESSGPS